MAAPVDLLRRVRLFEGLEQRELEGIAQSMKERGVAEIFTPGAPVSDIVDFIQTHVPVEA